MKKRKWMAWLLCAVMVLAIAPMPTALAAEGDVATLMLSNEEGGLIDQLIAAGHGDDTLYEVLQILQPVSGGAIPTDFMAALAASPADCDAKTAVLSDFSDPSNNPIGIGADGQLIVAPIHGRDYYTDTDFTTSTGSVTGVGDVLFTAAESEDDYIDAGAKTYDGSTHYFKAFAIVWLPDLTVAGTATDDTAILQIDNKTPSARDKTWEINVTSGTVKAGVAKADVTLSGLPAGLDYTAAKGTGNTIVITLTGAATTALTADATVTATIKGSAVTEADAQDSAGISLKLWYVGEATTFVISNEADGFLIDKLIAAGHGDDTLYEVLELLQPNFSGVITERFMKTLDSTPANSEIFDDEAALSNFAGLNGPVGINADGTLTITAIFGRDYDGDTGYTTTSSTYTGVGVVSLTTADSEDDYIPAGSSSVGGVTTSYYAFAIAWMPTGGGDPGPVAPTVVTNDASGITASGATLGGNVTASGGATVTERGFVYGSSANPTIGGAGVTKVTVGDGTGSFNTAITGLAASTPYHVRAYAINSAGTSYGTDKDFTTLTGGGGGDPSPVAPTVVTNDASGITASGATLGGNVTASGGATVTERGFVYGSSANPAIGGAGVTKVIVGDGTGSFNTAISGLAASTPYHVRAYAINSAGTSYGTDKGFTTLTTPPPDPDYIPRTLTDPTTGITVSGSLVHKDAALTVNTMTLHAAGTCAACDAIRQRMADDDFLMLIGKDISLSYGFQGSLTITIPVGSAYNGDTVTILHCANGTLQTFTATVKDGKATFTVTSLSPFAVFAAADGQDDVPKTGDGGGFPAWVGIAGLVLLAAGGVLMVLRRKKKKA